MTAIRGVISAICISTYTLIYNKSLFKTSFKNLCLMSCSGIAMFLTAFCYYSSMQASSVSTAGVLMYTSSVFVMLYSVIFLGEKLNAIKITAIIFMLTGCALVSGIVGGLKFSFIGIALGLLSGITYSVYNIISKIQMNNNCEPLTISVYCFIIMAIFSLIFSNPKEIITIASNNPPYIFLMIGCGVCTFVLPYFLFTLALKYLPAGTASSLSIIEPLAATLLSVTILNEKLTIFSAIGVILIVSAVFMLSKTKE